MTLTVIHWLWITVSVTSMFGAVYFGVSRQLHSRRTPGHGQVGQPQDHAAHQAAGVVGHASGALQL